jgi:hypothetical protein
VLQVVLADFFLGDQFTSQVLVFRNFEFIACYYSRGFFLSKEDEACRKNLVYQGLGYVVALLPYWWRFLQVQSCNLLTDRANGFLVFDGLSIFYE